MVWHAERLSDSSVFAALPREAIPKESKVSGGGGGEEEEEGGKSIVGRPIFSRPAQPAPQFLQRLGKAARSVEPGAGKAHGRGRAANRSGRFSPLPASPRPVALKPRRSLWMFG